MSSVRRGLIGLIFSAVIVCGCGSNDPCTPGTYRNSNVQCETPGAPQCTPPGTLSCPNGGTFKASHQASGCFRPGESPLNPLPDPGFRATTGMCASTEIVVQCPPASGSGACSTCIDNTAAVPTGCTSM